MGHAFPWGGELGHFPQLAAGKLAARDDTRTGDDRFSAAPTALGSFWIDFPALPGWADVWVAGPPGLASLAIFDVSFVSQLAPGKLAAQDDVFVVNWRETEFFRKL
jgi:hypothetical protein